MGIAEKSPRLNNNTPISSRFIMLPPGFFFQPLMDIADRSAGSSICAKSHHPFSNCKPGGRKIKIPT